MMIFARIVLGLAALMHAAFGVAYLFWPVKMAGMTKMQLTAPIAVTEMRTFYGGLEIGLAVFLALAAIRAEWVDAGLALTTLIYAGIVLARLLGMALDHSADGFLLKIVGVEVLTLVLAGAALAWIALRKTP
jgi:hypothetical protein